jgi:maltose alpha-D-glucosyltransferase/alpha-amylase
MIRSFAYISAMALFKQVELGALQEHDLSLLEPWAAFWHRWTSAIYLKAYLKALGENGLLPASKEQLGILLEAHLLEKTLQETGYELNNRPHLLNIPLRGLLYMLQRRDSKGLGSQH